MAAMAPEHAPHPLNLDSITALVHGFYADVRADPLLGPVFTQAIGAHWDAHLARMVDFWSTVALGSKRDRGNVAARHLALEVAVEAEDRLLAVVHPRHPLAEAGEGARGATASRHQAPEHPLRDDRRTHRVVCFSPARVPGRGCAPGPHQVTPGCCHRSARCD